VKHSLTLSILSDLHLRANEATDGPNYSRCDEKLDALRSMVAHAVADHHDMLILAGDIFDSREPPEWLMAGFIGSLEECFKHGIHVYIIVGNHETNGTSHCYMTLKTLERFSLHPGNSWPLHIVDEPKTLLREPDVLIHMVPYMKSEETIATVTNWWHHSLEESKDRTKILVGHCSVDGAELSGGNAYHIPTVLRKHHFSGYDLVLLGHIHQRQLYPGEDLSWGYMGSPLHQDFGEVQDAFPKGYYELCITNSEYDGNDFSLDTIPVESTPLIQVELEEGDTLTKEVRTQMSGTICKLMLSGSETWLKSEEVAEIKRKCRAAVKKGKVVKVVVSTRCTDRELVQAEEEVEEQGIKLDDSLQRLCKEKDKEAFLPDGRTYLEEANNALAKA